jgi:hypothetical protein
MKESLKLEFFKNPVKALIRPANKFKPILYIVVPIERLAALVELGKKVPSPRRAAYSHGERGMKQIQPKEEHK